MLFYILHLHVESSHVVSFLPYHNASVSNFSIQLRLAYLHSSLFLPHLTLDLGLFVLTIPIRLKTQST